MLSAPTERSLSVLLVEDSAVLAERLSELVVATVGVELAGVADSEASALIALGQHAVDVILLDLHLRQGTGFGVLRQLNKQQKRPVAIVLTNYDLAEYRRAASAMGAEYFLDKARDMDQLPAIFEQIRVGLA
jgi:two-component system, OmpR family, response regulator